ncbi:MAG: GGDEF domain-containing protein [Nitrospira sp.]|nr:MAG: GGDEF domain-containing protein [Nitrospira sp.]
MSVPPPGTNESSAATELPHHHAWSDDEALSRSYDAARFGALVCLLFMAGGLYWTAAIGLLTLSALTAYPVMVSIGVAFTLMIFGATFWSPRSGTSAVRTSWRASESDGTSTYDPVTGLPLNRLFLSLLNQALIRAQKHGRQVAVLMIELDYFTPAVKTPADLNRHLMYRIEAARVKSALRTTDTVARIAERIFAVLVDQVTGADEVVILARKMQGAIALPITLDQHEVFLTSRIGVALSNRDEMDANLLLDAAARALEAARTDVSGMSGLENVCAKPAADSTSTIAV